MVHISEIPYELIVKIINGLSSRRDQNAFGSVSTQIATAVRLCRSCIRFRDHQIDRDFIANYPKITQFQCSGPLTDEDLTFLARACPFLMVLDIDYPAFVPLHPYLFDGLLAVAIGCPNLRELYTGKRLNTGISHILKLLPHLTHFKAGVTMLDADIEAISQLRSLVHLDMSSCSHITNGGLTFLSGNTLTLLDLSSCVKISDFGIQIIVQGSCSGTLKVLKLRSCTKITDTGVMLLRTLSQLEVLDLCILHAKVTDIGCSVFSVLANLKQLYLAGLHKLTDATIITIGTSCPNLEELDLSDCLNITGDGIRALADLKSLRMLKLKYCDEVDAASIRFLIEACPALHQIVIDYHHGPAIRRDLEQHRELIQLAW